MLKTIVLLCAATLDHAACTKRTALAYVPLHKPVVVCGLGDAMDVPTRLKPVLGKSYIAFACEREASR